MQKTKTLLSKFLFLAFAVCLCLALALGFTACGEKSITKTEIQNGNLIVTYSNGDTEDLGPVVGPKGEKGDKGEDGEDGESPSRLKDGCAHTFASRVVRFANCSEEEVILSTCTKCQGYKIVIGEKDPDVHGYYEYQGKGTADFGAAKKQVLMFNSWEVPADDNLDPTCTDYGYTHTVCAMCNAELTNDPIDPNGHYYVATYGPKDGGNICEDGTFYAMYCIYCANVYEDKAGDVTGFDSVSTTALPGYYTGDEVLVLPAYEAPAANGLHTADSTWTVEVAPTLSATGLISGICTVCGEQKTIVLPKLSDSTVYDKTGAEDCTNTAATMTYTIKTDVQGYTGSFTISAAFGHKLGEKTFFEALSPQNVTYEYSDIEGLIGNGMTWSAGVPANCSEYKLAIFTCDTCSNEVAIKTKGPHTFANGDAGETHAPTCEEAGYITKVCTACEETVVVNDHSADALGHDYKAEVIDTTTIKLTCQRSGCASEVTVTPTNTVVTPATCLAQGYTTFTYVDPVTGTQTIVANRTAIVGHKLGEKTFFEALSVENVTYEYSDIEALIGNGMTWSAGVPANCSEYKLAIFTCGTCSHEVAIKTKGPHTFANGDAGETHAPTCEEAGYITKKCTACEETVVVNDHSADALGHDYKAEVINTTTIKLTCQRSGCASEVTVTPTNTVVTPATCLAQGYTTYTYVDPVTGTQTIVANRTAIVGHKLGEKTFFEALSVENITYEYSDVEGLIGNGMTWSAGVPANCQEYKLAIFTCDTCSQEVAIKTKGAHNYATPVNHPATCDSDAYKTETCIACGYVHTFDVEAGSQLAHNYVATVLEDGRIKLECSLCPAELTIIPTSEVVTPATCEAQGYTTYTYEDPVTGTQTIVANYTDKLEHEGVIELTWIVEIDSVEYECTGFVCVNGCGQLIVTSKVEVTD